MPTKPNKFNLFSLLVIRFTLIIITIFIPLSFWLTYEIYGTKAITHTSQSISIKQGESIKKIAKVLAEKKVITNPDLLTHYLKATHLDKKIKAGNYQIKTPISIKNLALLLTKPTRPSLIKVTIPEGYRLTQIANVLAKNNLISKKEFIAYVTKTAKPIFEKKYPFLSNVRTNNLEGFLFPDTYFFANGEKKSVIVDQFLKQFQKKVWPLWKKASKEQPKKIHRYSFYQIITLASLIEKEAKIPSEMSTISSVFRNRLKKRTQLASCPTVIYALGLEKQKVLTYDELKVKSPYNTYIHTGFPPTPISSPGIKAIKAALYPKKTNYLFFVSNFDGTHKFSKTYKQHLNFQKTKSHKKKKRDAY